MSAIPCTVNPHSFLLCPIGMFNRSFSLPEYELNIVQYISYDQMTHLYAPSKIAPFEITMFVLSYSMVTPLVVFKYLALSESCLLKAPLQGGEFQLGLPGAHI